MNKILPDLYQDVLQENFRLKDQVIHLSKQFKLYEQQIMDHLATYAPQHTLGLTSSQSFQAYLVANSAKLALTQKNLLIEREASQKFQQLSNKLSSQNSLHLEELTQLRKIIKFKKDKFRQTCVKVCHILCDLQELKKNQRQMKDLLKSFTAINVVQPINHLISQKNSQTIIAIKQNLISDFTQAQAEKNSQISLTNQHKPNEVFELQEEIAILRRQLKEVATKLTRTKSKWDECEKERLEFNEALIKNKIETETCLLALERCEKDKVNLEHYYDQKWMNQFRKVKANLESRFEIQEKALEESFSLRKRELELRNVKIQKQNGVLRREVENLTQDLQQSKLAVQNLANFLEKSQQNSTNLANELRGRMQELIKASEQNALLISERAKSEQLHRKQLTKRQQALQAQSVSSQATCFQLTLQHEHNMASLEADHEAKICDLKSAFASQKIALEAECQLKINKSEESFAHLSTTIEQYRSQALAQLTEKQELLKQGFQGQIERVKKDCVNRIIVFENKIRDKIVENNVLKNEMEEKCKILRGDLSRTEQQLKILEQRGYDDECTKREYRKIIQIKDLAIQNLAYEIRECKDAVEGHMGTISQLEEEIKQLKLSQQDQLKECQVLSSNFVESRMIEATVLASNRVPSSFPVKPKKVEQICLRHKELIRSLSQQNKALIDRCKLKEAENVILGQIKRHYQQERRLKHSSLELPDSQPNAQSHSSSSIIPKSLNGPTLILPISYRSSSNAIVCRKPKRMRAKLNEPQEDEETSKMRGYISRSFRKMQCSVRK